jgi:O-antigen ligase
MVLFLVAIPLGSNRDWAWPFVAAGFCLLSIYLLVSRRKSGQLLGNQFPSKPSLMAFGLVVFWMVIQLYGIPRFLAPITIDPYSTQSDILKTVAYTCVFFTTIGLVTTKKRCSITIYAVVFMGLLQAIIGVYGTLLGYSALASGTFPNSNHFAGYLEMALALGIGMMIATQSPTAKSGIERLQKFLETIAGPRGRLRLVLIIMVIGLVMSTSRMGNIAFLSSLLITSALSVLMGRKINLATVVFLASIVLIDALIIGNYFGIERIANRIQNYEQNRDIVSRVEINDYSLQMIQDHPLVGTGAGTYASNFPRYRQQMVDVRVTNAENDYFEFLVELGFIGSLPLLLIVVIGLSTQLRMMSTQNSQFVKGIAFGCLMGTISLLIHSAGDFNLQIPSNAVLFIVLLSLPHAVSQYNDDNESESS